MINKAKSFDRHSLMQGQVEVKKTREPLHAPQPKPDYFRWLLVVVFPIFHTNPHKKTGSPRRSSTLLVLIG